MRSTGQGVRGPSITHDRRRPPTGDPTERSRARPARLGWAIDCQKEGAIRGFARDTHRITFAARAEETSILQVLAGGRTTDATTRSCASRVFDGRPVMRPPWCPQHRWGGHFPYRSRRHEPPTCGRPGRGFVSCPLAQASPQRQSITIVTTSIRTGRRIHAGQRRLRTCATIARRCAAYSNTCRLTADLSRCEDEGKVPLKHPAFALTSVADRLPSCGVRMTLHRTDAGGSSGPSRPREEPFPVDVPSGLAGKVPRPFDLSASSRVPHTVSRTSCDLPSIAPIRRARDHHGGPRPIAVMPGERVTR